VETLNIMIDVLDSPYTD